MFRFNRNHISSLDSTRTEKFSFGVANAISTIANKSGISSGVIKSFIKLILDLGGGLNSIIKYVFLSLLFLPLILLVKDRYIKT